MSVYRNSVLYANSLISILFVSCIGSTQESGFYKAMKEATGIQDITVKTVLRPGSIVSPIAMVCAGDMYIIADENRKNMLHVYDESGCNIMDMLPSGHGANEITSIHQMQPWADTGFWILDGLFSRMLTYKKDSTYNMTSMQEISGFLSLTESNDTLIGICIEGDYRYKVMRSGTNKVTHMGSYEPYGLTPDIGKILLQGHMVSNPLTGKFAYFSYYGILWQFGSYRTGQVDVPEIIKVPEYSIDDMGNAVFDLDATIGFISIACSTEHVFALYSGSKIRDALEKRDAVRQGTLVFQFDWTGKIEKCYETDAATSQIAYDKGGKQLVMLSEDEGGYYIQSLSID